MGTQELNLDELLLDLSNPRFDGLSNQRDAMEKIVVSQGIKLVNLAEDIVAEGMSPAHRLLVMPAPKGSRGYIVMDGNRRLTALRILANPSVLDGMKEVGDLTAQKLRRLAREFDLSEVEPFDAYVCKDAQEARHWIEAIHTGENDGRGVVGWDGIATARYRGNNASLKVLEFVKSAGKLTAGELGSLERFPITNLDRLLGTPAIRERLGLTLEAGDLQSDLPANELLKGLKRIVLDLASKKVGVSAIKSKEQRIDYVDSLGEALPDLGRRTGESQALDKLSSQALSKRAHSGAKTSINGRSLLERKALIPPNSLCSLNISDHKLQQMCKELRKLPLDTYPVSIAATFRVFLELSLDHYGATNKLVGYTPDLPLKQKVDLVASALQTSGSASKRDLQTFRAISNNQNSPLNVDRLHAVVHSRTALPTAAELRTGWSEVQLAFTKIWA